MSLLNWLFKMVSNNIANVSPEMRGSIAEALNLAKEYGGSRADLNKVLQKYNIGQQQISQMLPLLNHPKLNKALNFIPGAKPFLQHLGQELSNNITSQPQATHAASSGEYSYPPLKNKSK